MTDQLERQLPDLLEGLGVTRTPDYFDDLLDLTAVTRQRRARWLIDSIPGLGVGRRPVLAPSLPWRPLALVALVVLLIAALLALAVGSHRTPAPPFGPARNGLIAYSFAGDVYLADPASGTSSSVLRNGDDDEFPTWSLDGLRLAFIRQTGSTNGDPDGLLLVADADGGHEAPVVPRPLTAVSGFEFSPDGRTILLTSAVGQRDEITIARTDGGPPRLLDIHARLPAGLDPNGPAYRPPDGSAILFAAYQFVYTTPTSSGIYLVNEDGSDLRTVVSPSPGVLLVHPTWSPDGSKVAYTRQVPGSLPWELHVVTIDGNVDRVIHTVPGTAEGWPAWSPDGSRLVIQRLSADGRRHVYAVVPSDGSSPGIEIRNDGAPIGANYVWAPDGTAILAIPDHDASKLLIWNPDTGATTTEPWQSGALVWSGRFPAWQRLAPRP
jgi:dipeptidyl aminopeptidase/acylaminoacyl peptidase